jgi:hypothetical protein
MRNAEKLSLQLKSHLNRLRSSVVNVLGAENVLAAVAPVPQVY